MKLSPFIPMLPVKSMPWSVEFYENLEFNVERRNNEWGWSRSTEEHDGAKHDP
jgi:hypothetical protein